MQALNVKSMTMRMSAKELGMLVLAALSSVTPTGMLFSMLLLLPFFEFSGDPVLDPVRHIILRLGAVCVLAVTFVYVTRNGDKYRMPRSGLKFPILLYLASAVVSITLSIVFSRIEVPRAIAAIATLLLLIGLAHSIPFWINTRDLVLRAVRCVLWSVAIVAILGFAEILVQVATGEIFQERIASILFHDPNIFARFMVVGIFLLLSLMVFGKGQAIGRGWGIALLVLLCVNILFSLSRSGAATLIVGLLFFAFMVPKRARYVVLLLTICIGGGMVAILLASRTFLGTVVLEPSNLNRIALILGGTEIIKEHWLLGIGYTNFGHYFEENFLEAVLSIPKEAYEFQGYATSIHNWLIEVWAEQGVVGVLGFIWFFFILFGRLRDLRRVTADPLLYSLLTGFTLMLFAFLFHGFFYHTFISQFPFWLFLGLALAAMNIAEQQRHSQTPLVQN